MHIGPGVQQRNLLTARILIATGDFLYLMHTCCVSILNTHKQIYNKLICVLKFERNFHLAFLSFVVWLSLFLRKNPKVFLPACGSQTIIPLAPRYHHILLIIHNYFVWFSIG